MCRGERIAGEGLAGSSLGTIAPAVAASAFFSRPGGQCDDGRDRHGEKGAGQARQDEVTPQRRCATVPSQRASGWALWPAPPPLPPWRNPPQTFVLVSVVFETAVNKKSMAKVIAPLAIGCALRGKA